MPSGNGQPRTYSIAADTATGAFNSSALKAEIEADVGITTALLRIDRTGDVLDIWFVADLSAPEITALDAVVLAHLGVAPLPAADSINIEDEDVAVPNTPHSTINFTGAGVTAADAGAGQVDVTIPGSSGSFQGLGLWRYRTEITSTPTSGRLNFDDVNIDIATEMYVNVINDGGTDMTPFLTLLGIDDLVYIQAQDDSTQSVVVKIGALPTLLSGVYTFPIGAVEAQGPALTNNETVAVLGVHSGAAAPDLPIMEFVADTEATSATSSLTINVPAGVVDDDTLVLVVTQSDGEDGTFNALAGWTEEVVDAPSGGAAPSTPETSVFTRKASSEPANYTVSTTNSPVGIVGKMTAWRFGDASVIFDVVATLATHTDALPDPASIDPVTDDCPILTFFWHDDDLAAYGSVPAGYTQIGGIVLTAGGGNGCSLGGAYKLTTGNAIEDPGTFNVTDPDEGGTVTIALRPLNPGASGGGADTLEVQDEGASLDLAVTLLNFLGAGVTAVENADHEIDITIPGSSSVFGTDYNTAQSLGQSTTTSTTLQQKLRLSVNVAAGNYVVHWALTAGNTSDEAGVNVRVQLDDATNLTTYVHGHGRDSGASDASNGGHAILALSGAHDIDVDFAASAGGTAVIQDVTLTLWRVT